MNYEITEIITDTSKGATRFVTIQSFATTHTLKGSSIVTHSHKTTESNSLTLAMKQSYSFEEAAEGSQESAVSMQHDARHHYLHLDIALTLDRITQKANEEAAEGSQESAVSMQHDAHQNRWAKPGQATK